MSSKSKMLSVDAYQKRYEIKYKVFFDVLEKFYNENGFETEQHAKAYQHFVKEVLSEPKKFYTKKEIPQEYAFQDDEALNKKYGRRPEQRNINGSFEKLIQSIVNLQQLATSEKKFDPLYKVLNVIYSHRLMNLQFQHIYCEYLRINFRKFKEFEKITKMADELQIQFARLQALEKKRAEMDSEATEIRGDGTPMIDSKVYKSNYIPCLEDIAETKKNVYDLKRHTIEPIIAEIATGLLLSVDKLILKELEPLTKLEVEKLPDEQRKLLLAADGYVPCRQAIQNCETSISSKCLLFISHEDVQKQIENKEFRTSLDARCSYCMSLEATRKPLPNQKVSLIIKSKKGPQRIAKAPPLVENGLVEAVVNTGEPEKL